MKKAPDERRVVKKLKYGKAKATLTDASGNPDSEKLKVTLVG